MAHRDPVLARFLEYQCEQGIALAKESDVIDLVPLYSVGGTTRYLTRFHCTGLLHRAGQVVEHNEFKAGINFTDDYLYRFDTARVLTWCEPLEIWHPNIRPPFVCAGRMQPGTPLVDLIYQLYEIITYHNVEMREHNALNLEACGWARNNLHRFPLDRRPLKRRMGSRES